AFIPSDYVIAFARAWEWSPKTAAQKLAPAFQRAWFSEVLFPLLRFRPLAEEEAIRELAGAANAAPEYKPQIKTIIDFLEISDLIKRENGTIRLSNGASQGDALPSHQTPDVKEPIPTKPVVVTTFAQPTQGMINFHVDVRVDMAEFAGWPADRIT